MALTAPLQAAPITTPLVVDGNEVLTLEDAHYFDTTITTRNTSILNIQGANSLNETPITILDDSTVNITGNLGHNYGGIIARQNGTLNLDGNYYGGFDGGFSAHDNATLNLGGFISILEFASIQAHDDSFVELSGYAHFSEDSELYAGGNSTFRINGDFGTGGGITVGDAARLELSSTSSVGRLTIEGGTAAISGDGMDIGNLWGDGDGLLELTGDNGRIDNVFYGGSLFLGGDGTQVGSGNLTLRGSSEIAGDGTKINAYVANAAGAQFDVAGDDSTFMGFVENLGTMAITGDNSSFTHLDNMADLTISGDGASFGYLGNYGTLALTESGSLDDASALENYGTFSVAGRDQGYSYGGLLANFGHVAGGSGTEMLEMTGHVLGYGSFDGNTLFNGLYVPEFGHGNPIEHRYTVFGADNLLQLNLQGLSPYALLDASIFTLGGSLELAFSSFMPTAGDVFDLLRADSITGSFAALNFSTLFAGLGLDWSAGIVTENGHDIFRLTVLDGAPVPEPHAALLLLACLCAVLLTRLSRTRPTS